MSNVHENHKKSSCHVHPVCNIISYSRSITDQNKISVQYLLRRADQKVKHNVNLQDKFRARETESELWTCFEKISRGAGLHAALGNDATSFCGCYTDAYKEPQEGAGGAGRGWKCLILAEYSG